MKKIFTLLLLLSITFLSIDAQTTLLDENCDAMPAEWTYNGTVSQEGGYWRIQTANGNAISPSIDGTQYSEFTLTVNLRSWGGGGVPSAQVSVTDGTDTHNEDITNIPNSYTDYPIVLPSSLDNENLTITITRTNPTGRQLRINNVKLDAAQVLPVEFKSFTTKPINNSSILSWSTSSEINNDYFAVETSVNGKQFEIIGKVEGIGNSNSLENYEFVHKTPVIGTNYYRLAQVDKDGTINYSNVVSTKFGNNGERSSFFKSNIISQNLEIDLGNQIGQFVLLSSNGLVVKNMTIENLSTIDVSELKTGLYIARIQIRGVLYSERIMISNN